MEQVRAAFGEKGLSSLKVGDEEFLADGLPTVVRAVGQDGKPVPSKSTPPTFDGVSKTLTVVYGWGRLTCRYEPIENGLRMDVTVENSSPQAIGALALNVLSLKSLGEGKAPAPTFGVEEPPFTFFKGAAGTAVLGVENLKFPLMLDFAVDPKKSVVNPRISFGGGRVVVDNVQMNESLAPGEKFTFRLVLRLASAGTDPMALAADFLDTFRKENPFILNWPDRRPIFRVFFGGGLPKDQAVANLKNPDGVIAPSVDEKFRDNLFKKIDGVIESARSVDAQGVVLWDLEGGTFPHAITYIGDPRLIRLLNPQMDLLADEAVRRLKDAGLRVGITLRPSRVIYDPEKMSARHSYTDAGDPFTELDGKIAYAKQRWGVTIFYVDTNFFWRPYGPDKKWQSGPLTSELWRRLRTKYPDTLFIPEFASTGDYASTAGYGEADMGNYGVPAMAKALYPDAFRVIVIEDADSAENFSRFVGALDNGNCLMTFGQGLTNFNATMIKRMQDEIALEKVPVADSIKSASAEELVKLLSSGEAAVRFQAARRLAGEPAEPAGARLLELAQSRDEPWPNRRAAVVALGKMPYPPAIPVLFALLEDRPLGLYADAARALAAQNASVEEMVIEKIKNVPGGKNRSAVYDLAGAVLVLRKAAPRAPALQEIFAGMPETDQQNRKALMELIGELRNPESEPFLLPFLADPYYAPVAASALVRIGSASGVAKAKAAAETAKKSGDKTLADALGRALMVK